MVYLKMKSSANFVKAQKAWHQKVEESWEFLLFEAQKLGFSISFIDKRL